MEQNGGGHTHRPSWSVYPDQADQADVPGDGGSGGRVDDGSDPSTMRAPDSTPSEEADTFPPPDEQEHGWLISRLVVGS